MIRIVVPWDPNRTNPNRMMSLHWAAKGKLAKQARLLACLCWQQAGSPVASGPVRVCVTVRRGRVMDQGNIWAGLKHVIDGIFVGALTPDDSPRWLQLGDVRQETGKQWRGREECEFLIEEVE